MHHYIPKLNPDRKEIIVLGPQHVRVENSAKLVSMRLKITEQERKLAVVMGIDLIVNSCISHVAKSA